MSEKEFIQEGEIPNNTAFFSAKWHRIVFLALLVLGLILRLYDLTDPPLDRAYRQLHSAIIARGFFYQMQPAADLDIRTPAIELGQSEDIFEPPIFEFLTAITYRIVGREVLWIPRLISIAFSLIGGIYLYKLALKIAETDGALIAFAFYWIGTWGMVFSRNFQPDGFMVMMVIIAAYSLHQWQETQNWKTTLYAGVFCGLSALIKIFAALFVGGMAVAAVLSVGDLKKTIKNIKVWTMAAVMVIIPFSAYFIFRSGASGYFSFWTLNLSGLLLDPVVYLRWMEMIQEVAGTVAMAISLIGVVILPEKARILIVGWWIGYIIYGLLVPWQIHTHDYYSVIIIPMISLGLAPIAQIVFKKLEAQPKVWRIFAIGVFLVALAYPSWNGRVILAREESRTDFKAWTKIGEALPSDGSIIALESSYGTLIRYFGLRSASIWPTNADLGLMKAREGNIEAEFDQYFQRMTQEYDYFLVTAFHELDQQPELKEKLYQNYPVYDKGDGYIIFKLQE